MEANPPTRGQPGIEFLRSHGIDVTERLESPRWGQAALTVFDSREGPVVVKPLPHYSPILSLGWDQQQSLFDELHGRVTRMILPLKLGGRYLHEYASSNGTETAMVLPWVGPPAEATPRWAHLSLRDHVAFAAGLSQELSGLDMHLMEALQVPGFQISFSEQGFTRKLAACRAFIGNDAYSACLALLDQRDEKWHRDCFNQLCHTDLHGSNLVGPSPNDLIAVDIDLLRVGNAYVDFLYIAVTQGVSDSSFDTWVHRYRELLEDSSPSLTTNTQLLGLDVAMAWLYAVVTRADKRISDTLPIGDSPIAAETLVSRFHHHKHADPALVQALTVQVPKFCAGLHAVARHRPAP